MPKLTKKLISILLIVVIFFCFSLEKRNREQNDLEIKKLVIDSIMLLKTLYNNQNELAKNIIDNKKENLDTLKLLNNYLYSQREPSYKELRAKTVYIIGIGKINFEFNGKKEVKKSAWTGTGVIVKIDKEKKKTYILTNKHVSGMDVFPKNNLTIRVRHKRENYFCNILEASKDRDMALLELPMLLDDKEAIKGYSEVQESDKVWSCDLQLGMSFAYHVGRMSTTEGLDYIIEMPSLPGASGSGVFDKDGYLVGLRYAIKVFNVNAFPIADVDSNHSLTIPGIECKKFVEKVLNISKEQVLLQNDKWKDKVDEWEKEWKDEQERKRFRSLPVLPELPKK